MGNVKEYNNLGKELAERLEEQYEQYVANNEIHNAYEVLGKLMAYRLIEKDDYRLVKGYKPYKAAGIDKDDRFPKDLRKPGDYIGDWLYADLPYSFGAKLISQQHIGKRVEGAYECDMVYPERELSVGITLERSPKGASNSIESIALLYKEETGIIVETKQATDEARAGYIRVYRITIDSVIMHAYKDVGFVTVSKDKDTGEFKANIVVRTSVFKRYHIDIEDGCNNIVGAVKNSLGGLTGIKVGIPINYTKAINEQREETKISSDLAKALLDERAGMLSG